jgi:hypothetical protein
MRFGGQNEGGGQAILGVVGAKGRCRKMRVRTARQVSKTAEAILGQERLDKWVRGHVSTSLKRRGRCSY